MSNDGADRQEDICANGFFGQESSSAVQPAFEDVVEQYYRPLYQFAFSLTNSEPDAWDLTQHTFYTWGTKGQQLRDSTKVKAWLFTTLHRAFLQGRRRQSRFPHYELEQVDSELPWISAQGANGLDSENVMGALGRIDDVFRTPLALYYLEDYPYKQIAAILDVPLGTVKSRIARGISQLKRLVRSSDCRPERVAA